MDTSFSLEGAAEYLAAFIDADGGVYYNLKYNTRSVEIYNTDLELVKEIEKCLQILDIGYRIHKGTYRGDKILYYVNVCKKVDLEKVLTLVPIRSSKKRKRLEECLVLI